MAANFLIYGSYGYSGRLIAQEAVRRGLRPVLAGRDAGKLERQASELGLESCVLSLDNPAALAAALDGAALVLHCAGPFVHTFRPMVEACLKSRTHYLDITGEIAVFEALAGLDQAAKGTGVMLLPGAGFDVVPTDCLASYLKGRLPSATQLSLAFRAIGRPSRGTAFSAVENIHRGGRVRWEGELVSVPLAWKTRQVDFGCGPVLSTTIPWGDVFTAYYSTGIENIEVYMAIPTVLRWSMLVVRPLVWLTRLAPVKRLLRGIIQGLVPGATAEQRREGFSLLWGEVVDSAGNRRTARMRTPEAYHLTALTAVSAAEKVLRGQATPGYQTPSLAFGADFILEFEGVTREDIRQQVDPARKRD